MLPSTVTIVLVGTGLTATDLPLPQEMTAMAMVGTFFLWLIRRENRRGNQTDTRLSKLESTAEAQRHLKHAWINRFAGLRGTLTITLYAAERCTCGAMTQVTPLLRNVLTAEDPT